MKKLLYIGRPNLGENLLATPCMELLAKEYEITLLLLERVAPLFEDYPFITNTLLSKDPAKLHKLPTATINEIEKIFTGTDCYYVWHHDDDINFLPANPELRFIKPYPVLHDKDVNKNVSRTRKYMQKLQLMTLEQCNNFDCTVRAPGYTQTETNNKVIVYQGSRDFLRCLPIQTIQKFTEQVPDAIYLVTQKTVTELKLKERNIEFIVTDPFVDENLYKVVKLFQSKPKVIIGPDAGLTQLATAYKVPLVWLQSRIRIEAIIDYQYKDVQVYRRKELTCKQDCFGYVADREYGTNILSYTPFKTSGHTNFKDLLCRKDITPSCLTYTSQEITSILSLVKS